MPETPKQEAKRLLSPVDEAYVFFVNDGRVLRDMEELAQALASMSEETYQYHANAEKNDFANWVVDIIKDQQLEASLRKAPSRTQAAKQAASRVSALRKKM